ncbi:type III secretion system translocon subunit SctE [Candidatus Protochlamydia phocaeensis]|uniref:type III secretion system translocon subunit SctE n=1 Tax=Candidatus Protochlamydia phocaeensis TaxID=1414722 RepID=UPI000838423A|nr:type III secretion system translocon subunit SctE [Candidatus Protochlamydia phocaeensis]
MGTDITGGNYSSNDSFGFFTTQGQGQQGGTGSVTDGNQAQIQFNIFAQGNDTISSLVTASFLAATLEFGFKDVYSAPEGSPTLSQPDPDNQPAVSPYGSTEQKMIKQFFSDQVTTLLQQTNLSSDEALAVYNSIINGTPLSDPNLSNIAASISQQATQTTIDEGNLPDSWTINSTDPNDWTPQPIQPYGDNQQTEINEYYDQTLLNNATNFLEQNALELTPDQAINLMNAIKTGQVSSDIADIYIQLSQQARVETQTAFGLPSTWFRGTTSVDDWKPINVGIVTPGKVAAAKLQDLLNNADQVLSDTQAAAKKLLDGPPPLPANDPLRGALTDFLKVIGDAIRNLKATLRELQVKDAETSKENSKAKFSELADRRIRAKEQEEKMEKMMKKQKEMKSLGIAMKIIGPIIAALATLIGALIAIASLGTATAAGVALIAAGITVGIAMTAYSIADSVTGCTQKLVEAFTKALDNMMPDAPDWAKTLVKVIIIAAIVAVLAVVIAIAMATGGGEGAATNMATQAVAQTVREAVIETIKQMAIQLMVMVIMSSNALPELVGNILKAAGVDKQGQAIAQAIVMAITLLAVIIAMGKMSGGGATQGADEAAQTTTQAAEDSVKSFSQRATELLEKIKDMPGDFANSVKEQVKALKEMSGLSYLNAAVKTAPLAVQAGAGIANGVMNLKVHDLLLQIGDLQAAEDLLKALIAALEKLLKNIQTGMTDRDGFIQQLQQVFSHIYNAATQSYGKLFQALQG